MTRSQSTPASSQIIWLENRVQQLEVENARLRAVLELCVPQIAAGYEGSIAYHAAKKALKGQQQGDEMTKKVIDKDEWWPVYTIEDFNGQWVFNNTHDIPNELIARYEKSYKEFMEIQAELRAIYNSPDDQKEKQNAD